MVIRMRVFILLLIVIFFALSNLTYAQKNSEETDMFEKYTIKPLNFNDVHIYGDLKRQFDEISKYYYNIPNDDLLKPYRQRAGLPAPGNDMGGVYIGHSPFGQFLAGYARIYAATKEEKYKAKALYLMNEWGKTIEDDGFFFDNKAPHLSAYYYEKLLGGLLDIYYFCNEPKALQYIKKITEWEEKNVPRTRLYCDTVGQGTGEWYTQSENLYRAYLYTKDDHYKDFAKVWEYTEFWDEILNKDYENMYKKSPWHHAYSHVNSFNGLGMAYIVTGDEKYLTTLKSAYDFMQNEQVYATGGFGSAENLGPKDTVIDQVKVAHHNFETQCGSWAGFKMTKYLTGLTGDAKYANWTEKLIINGIGASIPMSGRGSTFYYSEYTTTGAAKRHIHSDPWPCCSGTRPQAITDYHNLIYFYDEDSIYISQFFASDANFTIKNEDVKISQITTFPEEEKSKITIELKSSSKFSVKIRIPDWLAEPMGIKINGKNYDYKTDKNWAIIDREWKNKDIIEINLPMNLYISQIDPNNDCPFAIMYGPIALAAWDSASAEIENPATYINPSAVSTDFEKDNLDYMTWKLKSNKSIKLQPFYAFKDGQRYFLYLDKDAVMPISSFKKAKYTGSWVDYGDWTTSFNPNETCEFSYTGKNIRIHFFGYDDAGIFDVYIDGEKIGTLDEYNKSRGIADYKDFEVLTSGKHTLKLISTDEKNLSSLNTCLNISKFEILN